MLAAYRLAGLSALAKHYAGVNRRAQCAATRGRSLIASFSLALKIRRLAENSRLGDGGVVTSVGNPYRCVRVGS
jgi:hypothetical protein